MAAGWELVQHLYRRFKIPAETDRFTTSEVTFHLFLLLFPLRVRSVTRSVDIRTVSTFSRVRVDFRKLPWKLTKVRLLTGTMVVQVAATDADDPTYGNSARVIYSVIHGQPYFSVEPKTGR